MKLCCRISYSKYSMLRHVKIVVLFRDPRASISSAISVFCGAKPSQKCKLEKLKKCDCFKKNVQGYMDLKCKYPDRITMLRYEDLILEPQKTFLDLVRFLRLPPVQAFYDFYDNLAHENAIDKYERKLDSDIITEIENQCSKEMNLLGYSKVQTKEKHSPDTIHLANLKCEF